MTNVLNKYLFATQFVHKMRKNEFGLPLMFWRNGTAQIFNDAQSEWRIPVNCTTGRYLPCPEGQEEYITHENYDEWVPETEHDAFKRYLDEGGTND